MLLLVTHLRLNIIVDEPILEEPLLVEDMAQSRTLVMYTLAASLAHVLLAVGTIPEGVFFFAFRTQHSSSV